MKWSKARVDDLADLCLGKMLDQNKNRGELLPYLANINVRWGEFVLTDLRQMRFQSNEMDRYGLKSGDIVMCEGGEPGRCAIWKEQMPGMMIQKALHRIRARDGIDHRFLYYSFLHNGRNGRFGHLLTGATIKHLPRQNLAKLEVEFPKFPTQGRIADVLSAYRRPDRKQPPPHGPFGKSRPFAVPGVVRPPPLPWPRTHTRSQRDSSRMEKGATQCHLPGPPRSSKPSRPGRRHAVHRSRTHATPLHHIERVGPLGRGDKHQTPVQVGRHSVRENPALLPQSRLCPNRRRGLLRCHCPAACGRMLPKFCTADGLK